MTTKTDIAELTSEKLEEIRQRYRQTEVPKCHICGAEMTIQRMSASRITYGCAGAIYDETGCHYAEGRSLADDHYAESRITVVDVSDHDVLALVEALEKARQRIEVLESDLSEWTDCKHDGATYYDMTGRERCGRCGADI
ncbi:MULTISPECIES: ead/Ea22-like family protein [Klebsiella]|uniref:ead/Ea22-like family protein n=1 Tax=Klebsiella TaxID=570 RepID=UPI0011574CF2|nr:MULTISPECIES: ead/Ea22-like family protein [Klebsiella]MDM4411182.1 ead/Ea22-like family protein [Klebsiella oxytoca]UON93789.1 ead/Ea22-like family protein [Klebsiella michiganensis]